MARFQLPSPEPGRGGGVSKWASRTPPRPPPPHLLSSPHAPSVPQEGQHGPTGPDHPPQPMRRIQSLAVVNSALKSPFRGSATGLRDLPVRTSARSSKCASARGSKCGSDLGCSLLIDHKESRGSHKNVSFRSVADLCDFNFQRCISVGDEDIARESTTETVLYGPAPATDPLDDSFPPRFPEIPKIAEITIGPVTGGRTRSNSDANSDTASDESAPSDAQVITLDALHGQQKRRSTATPMFAVSDGTSSNNSLNAMTNSADQLLGRIPLKLPEVVPLTVAEVQVTVSADGTPDSSVDGNSGRGGSGRAHVGFREGRQETSDMPLQRANTDMLVSTMERYVTQLAEKGPPEGSRHSSHNQVGVRVRVPEAMGNPSRGNGQPINTGRSLRDQIFFFA